jgi:hypothetical protein
VRRLALLVVPVLLLGSACGGDGKDPFCDDSRALDKRLGDLTEAFDSDIPTAKGLDDAADAVARVAKDAPEEIEDDLATIVDGIRKIADVIDGIDITDPSVLSDPAVAARLQEAANDIEDVGPAMQKAVRRVADYLRTECDLQVDEE